MNLNLTRLALVILLLGAAQPALAQSPGTDKTFDLKPLVPPVLPPLPSNSLLAPGSVGAVAPSPYTAPLHDTNPQALPAPGIRLTIPAR